MACHFCSPVAAAIYTIRRYQEPPAQGQHKGRITSRNSGDLEVFAAKIIEELGRRTPFPAQRPDFLHMRDKKWRAAGFPDL
jgi:hypothetical protein